MGFNARSRGHSLGQASATDKPLVTPTWLHKLLLQAILLPPILRFPSSTQQDRAGPQAEPCVYIPPWREQGG